MIVLSIDKYFLSFRQYIYLLEKMEIEKWRIFLIDTDFTFFVWHMCVWKVSENYQKLKINVF